MLPGRLLQLVLGCAVHCDEKEEYIKKIMGLEEHVQTGVMQCIQVRNVENAHCDCFCLFIFCIYVNLGCRYYMCI